MQQWFCQTCFTQSCLRRGTGGYQNPKRKTTPYSNTTLSPPEWFCIRVKAVCINHKFCLEWIKTTVTPQCVQNFRFSSNLSRWSETGECWVFHLIRFSQIYAFLYSIAKSNKYVFSSSFFFFLFFFFSFFLFFFFSNTGVELIRCSTAGCMLSDVCMCTSGAVNTLCLMWKFSCIKFMYQILLIHACMHINFTCNFIFTHQ